MSGNIHSHTRTIGPAIKKLTDQRDELQATCDEMAEALESLEMAFVQTCENWLPSSFDADSDECVIKARAALARYRGSDENCIENGEGFCQIRNPQSAV